MYRYFCDTERKQIYDNRSTIPTQCKNNPAHIVDWKTLVQYYQPDTTTIDLTNLENQVNNIQTQVTDNTNKLNETTTIIETITTTGSDDFSSFSLPNFVDDSLIYGDILVSGITSDGSKNAYFKFQIVFANVANIISKVNEDKIYSFEPSNLGWTCEIQIISNSIVISVNSSSDTVRWKQYTTLVQN